jgi:hypothetical protein
MTHMEFGQLKAELRRRYLDGESPTKVFEYAQAQCNGSSAPDTDEYELFLSTFELDSSKLQALMAWAKRIPELNEDEINYLLGRAIEENAGRWKT